MNFLKHSRSNLCQALVLNQKFKQKASQEKYVLFTTKSSKYIACKCKINPKRHIRGRVKNGGSTLQIRDPRPFDKLYPVKRLKKFWKAAVRKQSALFSWGELQFKIGIRDFKIKNGAMPCAPTDSKLSCCAF